MNNRLLVFENSFSPADAGARGANQGIHTPTENKHHRISEKAISLALLRVSPPSRQVHQRGRATCEEQTRARATCPAACARTRGTRELESFEFVLSFAPTTPTTACGTRRTRAAHASAQALPRRLLPFAAEIEHSFFLLTDFRRLAHRGERRIRGEVDEANNQSRKEKCGSA